MMIIKTKNKRKSRPIFELNVSNRHEKFSLSQKMCMLIQSENIPKITMVEFLYPKNKLIHFGEQRSSHKHTYTHTSSPDVSLRYKFNFFSCLSRENMLVSFSFFLNTKKRMKQSSENHRHEAFLFSINIIYCYPFVVVKN